MTQAAAFVRTCRYERRACLAPRPPRATLFRMSIVRDEARGRYELPLGGGDSAVAVFHKRGDALAITHTEVPAHLEGRGHGSALMAAVLADVRARGEKVQPLCSFARAYMRRHPETQDLLA